MSVAVNYNPGVFHFGPGPGHLSKRAGDAADNQGATLVNFTEPSGEKRHWFICRNAGEPFNSDCAKRTMAAVRAAATRADQDLLARAPVSNPNKRKLMPCR